MYSVHKIINCCYNAMPMFQYIRQKKLFPIVNLKNYARNDEINKQQCKNLNLTLLATDKNMLQLSFIYEIQHKFVWNKTINYKKKILQLIRLSISHQKISNIDIYLVGDETCQVECTREVVNEIQDMFISWSLRFMQSLCMSEYFRLSMILQMFICLIRKKGQKY